MGPASAAAGPLLAILLVAGSAAAQTGAPSPDGSEPAAASGPELRRLIERVEGLERRLGASALLELVARIEQLTKENRELRDRVEVQERALEALRNRQRDLYTELDRIARRTVPAASSEPPGAAEAPGATTASDAESPEESEASGAASAVADPGGSTAPASDSRSSGESEPVAESTPRYDPMEEQGQYQRAFDLLSEGRFERAAKAFTEFLAAFPESRYRDNAMFWKGECLYALRRFDPALEEFTALVETLPESSRVPGAKLKIGFILHELGRAAEAAEVLRNLVETAPDSSEAKLARDRLARME